MKRKKALYVSRYLPQALADSKLVFDVAVSFAWENNMAIPAQASALAK